MLRMRGDISLRIVYYCFDTLLNVRIAYKILAGKSERPIIRSDDGNIKLDFRKLMCVGGLDSSGSGYGPVPDFR
jgi:hypothetical protein